MKIAKTRLDYIFLIYIPFALIGVCLIAFAMNTTLTSIKWLMLSYLPICLVLACISVGSKKLLKPESSKPQPLWRWLTRIISLQLGILLIFTALTQANIHLLTIADPVDEIVITQLANHYWQNCLLPWPWSILTSIVLAFFGKKHNQPALLLTAVKPIIRFFADNIIGVGIEIFIRQTLQMAGLFVIAIVTFSLADSVSQLFNLPSLLLADNHAFILSIVIFIVISIKPFTQLTRWLWQKHFSNSTYLLIFCGLTFAFILIANVILNIVDPYLTNVNLPSLKFSIFSEQNWATQWQLISYCWWVGIMPLLAFTLANLNRGRNIRTIILGNLLLPITLASVGFLIEYYSPDTLTNLITAWLTAWPITLLIGFTSLFVTAFLYRNPETCGISSNYKTHSQLTLTSLRTTWHLGALFIVTYLVSQLSLIYILSMATTIPVLATLFVAIIGAAFVAIRKQRH